MGHHRRGPAPGAAIKLPRRPVLRAHHHRHPAAGAKIPGKRAFPIFAAAFVDVLAVVLVAAAASAVVAAASAVVAVATTAATSAFARIIFANETSKSQIVELDMPDGLEK